MVNQQGADVFVQSDTLVAGRFEGARAADYRLTLPLAALDEGEFLLTIDAARSQSSAASGRDESARPLRRDVRFRVRQ